MDISGEKWVESGGSATVLKVHPFIMLNCSLSLRFKTRNDNPTYLSLRLFTCTCTMIIMIGIVIIILGIKHIFVQEIESPSLRPRSQTRICNLKLLVLFCRKVKCVYWCFGDLHSFSLFRDKMRKVFLMCTLFCKDVLTGRSPIIAWYRNFQTD